MKREEKVRRLKEAIDKYVSAGGSIQDENKKLPYFNLLKVLIRSDRKEGVSSSLSSVYKECGYDYIEKKKPLTIERIKQEIAEYVASGGSIFDAWDSLPYRGAMSAFISMNEGWNVKKVYEACGYEYKDKPEPVTLERLKAAIDKHIANGGSIYDARDELPYVILLNNYIRNNKSDGMDIVKAYKLCGYDYDLKKKPVTIERIKEEIAKFVENGGNIYDKSTEIPYYDMIQHFIERYRRNGVKYTVEEVYKMCGYDYDSMYYNVYKLGSVLKDYKDSHGYVDSLKDSDFGRSIYERLKKKAQALELDLNDYLMCMFGVKMKHSFSSVDYISLVEEKLKEHESLYGYKCVNLKHISKYNPQLLNKVRHLAMYFPEGSVSMNDVLYYFDYEETRKKAKPLDEKAVLASLEKLYPNKMVTNLSSESGLYTRIVRLSVSKNMTIDKYLSMHGYKVNKSQDTYRLSKAIVNVDKEKYEQICYLRKDLISKSKILNNPDSTIKEVNEELEKIGLKIINIMHIEQKPLMGKLKR